MYHHLTTDSAERKAVPIATGVLDYFPDALAEVARLSKIGNDKHNPGQPLHWARGKSDDHADCILRHMIDRGAVDTDGVLHDAKVAWRALAQLQLAIEKRRATPVEVPPMPEWVAHRKAGEPLPSVDTNWTGCIVRCVTANDVPGALVEGGLYGVREDRDGMVDIGHLVGGHPYRFTRARFELVSGPAAKAKPDDWTGRLVRCVDDIGAPSLTRGQVYRVGLDDRGLCVSVDVNPTWTFDKSRFELVE